MDLGSATFPEPREWQLRSTRTREIRIFQQMELSIEAEAKLIGLVYRVAAKLTEADFPWDKLASLFDYTPAAPVAEGAALPAEPPLGPIDWPIAIQMLASVAEVTPEAVVDSVCLFLAIHADNPDGTPNTSYDETRRYLKDALSFTIWIEMIKTFAKQNDYERLVSPFGRALGSGAPGLGRSLAQRMG